MHLVFCAKRKKETTFTKPFTKDLCLKNYFLLQATYDPQGQWKV